VKGVWWHQFVYRLDSWPNDQLAVGYDDSKDGVNLISGLKKEYGDNFSYRWVGMVFDGKKEN